LLIRMPEMHFPSIWHHHHNLSNHEVQQLTFILFMGLLRKRGEEKCHPLLWGALASPFPL